MIGLSSLAHGHRGYHHELQAGKLRVASNEVFEGVECDRQHYYEEAATTYLRGVFVYLKLRDMSTKNYQKSDEPCFVEHPKASHNTATSPTRKWTALVDC